jgi:hypothetical protein
MSKNIFAEIAILFILLLLFFGLGCKNPFTTRESPPPVGQEGDWNTPSSPMVVMENLFNSYNQKIIGNFNLCFSDNFKFSAPQDSIEAISQGQGWLFENWDVSVERGVAELIFATSRQAIDSLDFFLIWRLDPSQNDIVGDTTAIFYRDYTLYKLVGSPPETTVYRGLATFYLEETAFNWWSIYMWEDIPWQTGQPDWADFKAEFRRQLP